MDHVHSRYMEPKQGPSQMAMMANFPERQRFPKNTAYDGVNTKYLEPKTPPPKPRSELGPSPEMIRHMEATKKSFPELRAKFIDEATYQPKENSPRRLIEDRIQAKKKQRALWRSDTIVGTASTFDDLRKLTDAVERPKTRVIRAPSPVAQYIKSGVPIPSSNPNHNSPNRARSNSPSRVAGLRSAPPLDENGKPKRFPAWHAAGPTTKTFDNRWRETATARPSYAVMEKRIESAAKERLSVRVNKNHVPRVAGLSIAELAAKEEEEHQQSASQQRGDEPHYILGDDPHGGVKPIHWT